MNPFALFNSANVEGWGLYAEAIVRPYLPLEAQLISLQYRLMRAARMFLDPMLNLGQITPDEAKALLLDDVAVGEGWAQNEVELRDQFDQQAFHDFVLAQGLLPPAILKDAVMNEFVPSQLN